MAPTCLLWPVLVTPNLVESGVTCTMLNLIITSKISIRTKTNRPLRDWNRNTLQFDSRMILTLKWLWPWDYLDHEMTLTLVPKECIGIENHTLKIWFWNDLGLWMTLILVIIIISLGGHSKRIWYSTVRTINFTDVILTLIQLPWYSNLIEIWSRCTTIPKMKFLCQAIQKL